MASSGVLASSSKKRLLEEMLRSVPCKDGEWRVLILDDVTLKVFSSACKLSDVTEENVSLVEDLYKSREPMPHMSAIYFISPSERSVRQLIDDFASPSAAPLYRKAHVFFSNQVEKRLLNGIKGAAPLTERLGTLKEFPMEYITFDSRTFTTATPDDLNTFYSAGASGTAAMDEALDDIVSRLATLFVSLRETPSIRFRAQAGRAAADDEDGRMREMLAGRLAGELAARMGRLQEKLPDLPAGESCDLLILDRGADAVSPVVHDWSYECLCRDLLRMKGNQYRYKYTANSGKTEEKDVALDESDPLFRELRSAHLADVLTQLAARTASFTETNKAAGRKKGPELDVSSMKKVVESLPAYREQLQKLSVHTTVSDELSGIIKARSLNAVGTLEQELVFGDATSKELLKLLETLRPAPGSRAGALQAEAAAADRLRLLLCYFGSHAEKLDGASGVEKWKAAAALQPGDMAAVLNLELLGCPVLKKPAGAAKTKKSRRKASPNEEGWDLPKFTPRLAELVAELGRGELSQEAFPFTSPPTDAAARGARSARAGTSVRTVRPGAGNPTWASKRGSTESLGSSGSPSRSRRLFVFMLGPISYNEIRAVHEAAAALGRDVMVGATSVATPEEFLSRLKALRGKHESED